MTLWAFSIACDDGTIVEQTVLAEGAGEADAAVSALTAINDQSGLGLSRPGTELPSDVEGRWREVFGTAFPGIVSNAGRLALYARGDTDPPVSS